MIVATHEHENSIIKQVLNPCLSVCCVCVCVCVLWKFVVENASNNQGGQKVSLHVARTKFESIASYYTCLFS